jgi:hypothetical protein
MKYIKTFESYTSLQNEGWLSDKLSQLSSGAKSALTAFTNPFKGIVTDIKTKWKEGMTGETIRQKLIDVLDKSITNATTEIEKIESEDDLLKVYNDIKSSIVMLKDTLDKEINASLVESLNYMIKEAVISVTDMKATVDGVLTSVSKAFAEFKDSYKKEIAKQKDIKEKKATAKKFIKDHYDKVKAEIMAMDITKMIQDAKKRGAAEEPKNVDYTPGMVVTFRKRDGSEATAKIANDQSEAEDGYLLLVSMDKNSIFAVPKTRIVGKAEPGKTINWNKVDLNDINDMNQAISDYMKANKGFKEKDINKARQLISILKGGK